MASTSAFQNRLDEMNNDARSYTLKRKSLSGYSTPTRRRRYDDKSLLLGLYDKRMKSAQWDPTASFLPHTARPTPSHFNPISFHALPRTPQFSPIPRQSGIWSVHKATITELTTPLVPATAGRAYGQLQNVPLDSRTVSESSRVKQLESLLRSQSERHKAVLHEKDRETADLQRKYEKQKKFSSGVMETLERVNADLLRKGLTLETNRKTSEYVTYRNRVNALRESRSTGDKARIAQEDKEEGNIMGGCSSRDGGSDWKELLSNANDPSKSEKRISLDREIAFSESKLRALQLDRPGKSKAEKKSEVDSTLVDAFTPLPDEAESAVDEALRGPDRYQVLTMHEASNIDVTRAVMQCLLPGTWLNDEVINVYMELLKERELREPNRFLKCHFFNTFFYNKLFKDKHSYNYKAIRRWTTQKKLGYSLYDCDKVLVPIHQDIHWCLAVINIRDKKLEYLDSLKGGDRDVLDVLAKYIADEVKDKDGKVLDMESWEQEFPQEIPEQLNGCDCGMFMVKYADFHSRGAPLQFSQENMEYFRRKMVWEILQLKAT